MPIPPRLQLQPVSTAEIRKLSKLCNAIEDGINRGDDVTFLLQKWHRHATRPFEPFEFTTYYGSVSTEEFVKGAILPRPQFVDDVTYEEIKAVLQAVGQVEFTDQADLAYYLEWLETNLPGSNISDLMYWPNQWFQDDSRFLDENGCFKPGNELNDDQVLRYAMLKSGRMVPHSPDDVPLPFPIPEQ